MEIGYNPGFNIAAYDPKLHEQFKVNFQSWDWYTGESSEPADGLLKFGDQPIQLEFKNFATPANPLAMSGQHLAAFEHVRGALEVLAKQELLAYTSSIDNYYELLQAITAGKQIVWLPDGSVVTVENEQVKATLLQTWSLSTAMLFRRYRRTRRALRFVRRHLAQIRKIFHSVSRRSFYGFDWSKRVSSLLHGSHPPKIAAPAVVVGCA
jgi:hypothetical protein